MALLRKVFISICLVDIFLHRRTKTAKPRIQNFLILIFYITSNQSVYQMVTLANERERERVLTQQIKIFKFLSLNRTWQHSSAKNYLDHNVYHNLTPRQPFFAIIYFFPFLFFFPSNANLIFSRTSIVKSKLLSLLLYFP